MFERFIESKPIESEIPKPIESETPVKRLAKEMLGRFYARVRKSGRVEHDEEKTLKPATEDVTTEEITAEIKEEIPDIVTTPERPEIEPPKPEVTETKDVTRPQKKERERKTEKGIYESIVTNHYFEGWDEELLLEGNAGIKDKIRENIIQAEKRNQRAYEDAAADLRISVEEFKARLQAKIEDMVERAEFFRATQLGVLEKIMNVDGRWKSQFETGTSQGTLDPRYRAGQEKSMFGFEDDLEKDRERRPIYGYFSDEEHGAINCQGKIPPPTNVHYYGTVNVKIKKEGALKKATITFHDSLCQGSGWPPTPAAKPHFTSFRLSYHGGRILEELKGPSVVNWGESYTEVQYHGQLTMDDVESIHISTHNGLYPEDIEEVRRIFNKYKQQHPESTIQLIEF